MKMREREDWKIKKERKRGEKDESERSWRTKDDMVEKKRQKGRDWRKEEKGRERGKRIDKTKLYMTLPFPLIM